jgi:rod shape determining protein RodA
MKVQTVRDFDFIMLLASAALVAFGALLIYSGSLTTYGDLTASLSHPVVRQVAFAAVGIVVSILLSRLDYRVLGAISTGLYVAAVASLMFVLVVGEATYGSRRWVVLGDTQVQPSEVAKLIIIIVLAKYLVDRRERLHDPRVFLTSLGLVAVPTALVFAQPDLGSAVIFVAIWLGMVVIAGVRPAHVLGLLGAGLVSVPFVFLAFVSDYQRERIALWLDPSSDSLGSGFNILQAEISIGSGGILGKGLTHGTQTQLDYLRTQTTDYVFSVLGEELGLVGALVLFGLFIILLFRGMRVASVSADMFGRLMATGIVIFIVLQVFINIGMNLQLVPVTGIPLPFISQGGSSLITLFIALGILQSIVVHHRRFTF